MTSSPGGLTGTGSSSPIAVDGLTPGTSYTFTVAATNGVGTGPPSSPSLPVTPWRRRRTVDCDGHPGTALQDAIAAASDGDTLDDQRHLHRQLRDPGQLLRATA